MSLEQLTEDVREKVAGGGIEESVKFDLGDAGIIFLQGSEVSNDDGDADCTIKMTAEDLGDLLWSFAPPERPAPRTFADLPATTDESTAMARALKQRGFRFVGPTTCYALMQAVGMVNDHLAGCDARAT